MTSCGREAALSPPRRDGTYRWTRCSAPCFSSRRFKVDLVLAADLVLELATRAALLAERLELSAHSCRGVRGPIEELRGSRPVDALLHQDEAQGVADRGEASFAAPFARVLPLEIGK